MTVVFAGGELDAFFIFDGVVINTSSGRRNTDFSRLAMVPRNLGFIQADFASLTEGWAHITLHFDHIVAGLQDRPFIQLIDSGTGQTVIQIDGDNGFFNLEYWNGAALVELLPNIPFLEDVTQRLDLHWKIADSGGIFEAYLDGTLRASFAGDTLLAGFTQIDRLRLFSSAIFPTAFYDIYYSEIIVATEETIGWHLATLVPDGVGNSTTWTGDNTDIDAAALNDLTFVSSGTAEQLEQFTVSDLSSEAALLDVEAVVVAARSRNAASGPQNIQLNVRTGGADFFGSNLPNISIGFTTGETIWDLNPDTAAKWTVGEVNLLEIGVKSKP